MDQFKAKFISRVERTQSVTSFQFQPQTKLDFLPGQFAKVMFDEQNPRNRDLNKYLSFSSSPQKEHIEFTKRISTSDFSRNLNNLVPGQEISFQGPSGRCVYDQAYKRIGFLIGGIGITPVISILEYIAAQKLKTDVVLIYSNRTPEEIAFKPELDGWKKEFKNIKVVYTVTDCPVDNQECLVGRIDENILKKILPDARERKIFIFGPPAMVKSMENLCLEHGCAKDSLLLENFVGY